MNPGVFLRAKAAAIDGFILLGMMLLISSIGSKFPDIPNNVRIGSFVVFALLYDPLMTMTTGQTIGHKIMGIRVVRFSDATKKISFLSAFLRFIIKAILGWLSLLTVGSNKDKRAIHDLFCNSKVTYNL